MTAHDKRECGVVLFEFRDLDIHRHVQVSQADDQIRASRLMLFDYAFGNAEIVLTRRSVITIVTTVLSVQSQRKNSARLFVVPEGKPRSHCSFRMIVTTRPKPPLPPSSTAPMR